MASYHVEEQQKAQTANRMRLSFGFLGLLLAIVSFLTLATPTPVMFVNDPDSGLQLAGAFQILRGEHPIIQWASTYGPLVFYASALAQRLSGGVVGAEIALCILGYTVAYLLFWHCCRDVSGSRAIALTMTAVALLLLPRFYKYYVVLGPVLSLALAFRLIERPSWRSLMILAIAVALTGLFRPDFGVYAFLGCLPAVLFAGRQLGCLSAFATGYLGIVVGAAAPYLLFLVAHGGFLKYLTQQSILPVQLSSALALPMPWWDAIRRGQEIPTFMFFFALTPVALVVLIKLRHSIEPVLQSKIACSILLGLLDLGQAMHRSDMGHLLQAIPISLIVIAWLLGMAWQFRRIAQTGRFSTTALVVIGALLSYSVIANSPFVRSLSRFIRVNPVHKLQSYWVPPGSFLDVAFTPGSEPPVVLAIKKIRTETDPESRIWALPFMPQMYYLAERKSCGGLLVLAPGYFTGDRTGKVLENLGSNPCSLIVESRTLINFDGREDRAPRNYAPEVFDFIDQNYVEVPGVDETLSRHWRFWKLKRGSDIHTDNNHGSLAG